MKRRANRRLLIASIIATAMTLAACGTGDGGEPTTIVTTSATTTSTPATTTTIDQTTTTTTTVTTTTEPETTRAILYFFVDDLEETSGGPFIVPVYRETTSSDDAIEGAVRLLLQGPTEDETAGTPAISTAIPEGVTLNGIQTSGGTASVDLSAEFDDGGGSFSMFGRLAQVVFTLTRFPEIEQIVFELEGEPVEVFSSEGIEIDEPLQRDDYLDRLPPIFVDSPAWGEPVTSPILVRGLSNVFEATSQVMLTDDDGLELTETTVSASCGTGCWGEWETELPYSVDREQYGALIVWEISAKDGSRVNIREYPILLR